MADEFLGAHSIKLWTLIWLFVFGMAKGMFMGFESGVGFSWRLRLYLPRNARAVYEYTYHTGSRAGKYLCFSAKIGLPDLS